MTMRINGSGHVDILVNNGQQQPGCTDNINKLVRSAKRLVTLDTMKGNQSSFNSFIFIESRLL